jgi:hypothetical protein
VYGDPNITKTMTTPARLSTTIAKELATEGLSLFMTPILKRTNIEAFMALRKVITRECRDVLKIAPSGAKYYCVLFETLEKRDAALGRISAKRDAETPPSLRLKKYPPAPIPFCSATAE